MKRALLWCVASLFLASCAATNAPPAVSMQAPKDNKVMLPSPDSPLVSIRLMFRSGSADDPPGKEGLTALTASLMAEGGTRELSAGELIDALYPMAADLSVQTDKEVTTFIGRVHKDHLKDLARIMTDVVTAPRLEQADFERLRTEALKEVQVGLRSDDDETLGKVALEAFLYPRHPYGHPVVGTVSGLKNITLEDVKLQVSRAFSRDGLTIGVAGGYPADFPALLEERLRGLPVRGMPRLPLPEPERIDGVQVQIVQKETPSTAVSLGFPYDVTRADPSTYVAMRLVASYLGEHRQSVGILYQRLRGMRGLNYGDYAYAEAFQQEGWGTSALHNIPRREQQFTLWLRPVPEGQGAFVLRAALREFDQLAHNGMTKEDFERTRSFLKGYSRLWEQTGDRRLGYALDGRFYGALDSLDDFRKVLDSLTLEQVNAAIKKHLNPSGMKVVMVTRDAEGLAKLLKSGSPSPIQYASPKGPSILAEDKSIEAYDLRLKPERVTVVPVGKLFE